MNRPLRRRHLLALTVAGLPLSLLGLQACQRRSVPIVILTSFTGAALDQGTAVRDGALLAFEMRTELGLTELSTLKWLVFDDALQLKALPELAARIAATGAVAVLGPMTSEVTAHWIPLAQAKGLLSLSPTASSHDFSGLDDVFFRVVASTHENASKAAQFAVQRRALHRWAIIRDDSNAAYSRSWADFFAKRARALGAVVAEPIVYQRPIDAAAMQALLRRALAPQPQALALVTDPSDAASLAQLLRHEAPPGNAPAMLTAEWAASEQLIFRGGRAVEGVLVSDNFDRDSQASTYLRFVQRLRQRFGRTPTIAEVASFDAAYVLMQALTQRRTGEALKDTLLRVRSFSGVQGPIVFDDYGDYARPHVMNVVYQGRFRALSP